MSTSADRQAVSNLQDVFLNGARRERLHVTVRLMDGTEVCGRIKSFDRYALLVEHDESDVLLFKHAVATIRPRASAGPRPPAPWGPARALSSRSRGRLRHEPDDPIRPAFQRDRDRIVHSKAFRRLKHKTQVFLAPTGDHYRTRLTHTLEVSQIARTIAKVLRLNEELTEAIALGHDLGHAPFGHAGERVLTRLFPGGFNHYEQSLRVVDVLEQNGAGLNLTWEVRDGISKHSKGKHGAPVGVEPALRAATLEGQVARVADLIAYVNHDIDDAVRAGILRVEALPPVPIATLGATSSERIGCLVADVVRETLAREGEPEVAMSAEVLQATLDLRAFLHAEVYENDAAVAEFAKACGILEGLWEKVRERPARFLDPRTVERDGLDVAAKDFLAGMTDRFAIGLFEQVFVPRPWGLEGVEGIAGRVRRT